MNSELNNDKIRDMHEKMTKLNNTSKTRQINNLTTKQIDILHNKVSE